MTTIAAVGGHEDLLALGTALFDSLPAWVGIAAVGVGLLFFGRRLYWLLLGVAGFLLGFGLLSQLVAESTSLAPLIAGLAGGLLGVIAAFVIQGALLAVVGAVLGAIGSLVIASMWGLHSSGLLVVVAVLGSVVGALVLQKLFFGALMVSTAVLGAGMLIEALSQLVLLQIGVSGWPMWTTSWTAPGPERTLLFVLLVALGVLFQARKPPKERYRRAERDLKRERQRLEKRARALR